MEDSTQPEFWERRYAEGRTPWDHGGVPPALGRFLARWPGRGRRVLIPGCGSGHEIAAFAAAGCRVTAIDLSAGGVARARRVAAAHPGVDLRQADFFAFAAGGRFDLIYERTFVCALPPALWPRLAARMADLLAPDGWWAGLFFHGPLDPDGPPFGLGPDRPREVFDPRFELLADESVPADESLPFFAGHERWQVRRARPSPTPSRLTPGGAAET